VASLMRSSHNLGRSFCLMSRAPKSFFLREAQRQARRVALGPFGSLLSRKPETVVRVPPLDDAFVSAIKLVAPQYPDFTANEQTRLTWEQDQNNSCWAEEWAVGDILSAMPPPKRILEIGPGFGRSAAFFSKRRFPNATFDLFDATGGDTKYEMLGKRYEDSFCGNLPLLERNLEFNGVSNYRILDARESGGRLSGRGDKYDLIYSFYAVGFHWSIEHWLDEIIALSHDSTLGIFIVPSNFLISDRVRALPHRIVQASPPMRPWVTIYFLLITPKPQPWFDAA